MQLKINLKDNNSVFTEQTIPITLLAFIKHFAIAGQGYLPNINKFKRTLGSFLLFEDYLKYSSFNGSYFSTPPPHRSDPTEMAQFSNRAGKAFADYLGKKFSGAKITFNYEAAMRLKGLQIKGGRPDLLCDTGTASFSMEAKGFSKSSISDQEMIEHKKQAQQGPISIKFSIACVAYNLYEKIKINYFDPSSTEYKYDKNLTKELTKEYVGGALSYINGLIFEISTLNIKNRNILKLTVSEKDEVLFMIYKCLLAHFKLEEFAILIDQNLKEVFKTGNINIIDTSYESGDIYIDSDGFGLQIKKKAKQTYKNNTREPFSSKRMIRVEKNGTRNK